MKEWTEYTEGAFVCGIKNGTGVDSRESKVRHRRRDCFSSRFGPTYFRRISTTVLVWLVTCLVCSATWADPSLPHSVLVLDQSAPLRPWSTAIMHAVQSVKSDKSGRPISYHVEHLDLFGFGGRQYDDNLLSHLIDKYSDKPIDVILSIGPGALDFAVKLRATAWPAVPIVFTAVNEETAPHTLPSKTTGFFVHKTFANMVKAAQTILPNLRRLVLVGNPFEGAVYYPQFAHEIPKFSAQFEIIDLMGLPVREIRQRVAALPPDSAVFYFGINADPERRYASAVEPLTLIAEATSRPIIGDAETEIGAGAIGGFVLRPDEVGRDAGRLVMRILDGEDASDIPVAMGNTLTPMFDWQQLQMQSVHYRALKVKSEQSKPDVVHISIEDTGTGIDPSNLNRVFTPLFTTKERGMGMGLSSICHSIIENRGGRIWVSPGLDRGSIFQCEIPAASAEDAVGAMAA
jgi:ABC-type uncharacterized transport system substrate-binding protein